MEERELLRRLRRGDPSALEELMDRDMGFACGLAGSVLRGRPRDAEEVVSDAFLALWEHAGQVEPGKLRPWLGRVVRNKALNRLRTLGGELPLEEDWLALEPDRAARPGGGRGAGRAGGADPGAAERTSAPGSGHLPAPLLLRPDRRRHRRGPGHAPVHGEGAPAPGAEEAEGAADGKGVFLCLCG